MFQNSNRRQFQKGLDTEKARAKRCDTQLLLRRKQREARLQKKVRLLTTKTSSCANKETELILESIPLKKDISKYIANVMQTDNTSLQLYGLCSIRKLLATDCNPTQMSQHICFNCNNGRILTKIIQFMYNYTYNKRLAYESAWAITNICGGTKECTMRVVKYGGIEAFVDLLRNTNTNRNQEIATQTIWGLGNIASDGNELVQRILCTGVLKDIVEIINESSNFNSELHKNALWAVSNMLRFGNSIKLKVIKELDLVSKVIKVINNNNKNEIIEDCLWIFNFLSMRDETMCVFMAEQGCINIVMKLLSIQFGKYEIALNQSKNTKKAMLLLNERVYLPCLRFIGNILSCGDYLTQIVLDCGYLDIILPFTFHHTTKQRKEVMWSLSNILAGTPSQIECILSRNKIIKSIINCAKNDILLVRVEACYGICNVVNDANIFLKKQLAEYGAIEALVSLLNPINNISEQNLLIIIEGLEAFLETFCDVLNINPFAQKIEECQGLNYLEIRSVDDTISQPTWNIIINLMKKYWGELQKQEISCKFINNTNKKQFKFGINSFINNTNYGNNNNCVGFNF